MQNAAWIFSGVGGTIVGILLTMIIDRIKQRKKKINADYTNFEIGGQTYGVYRRGENIPAFINSIKTSEKVMCISYAPFQMLFSYTPYFTEALENGCEMRFLIANSDSLLLKQISAIEDRNTDSIGNAALESVSHLNTIVKKASKSKKTGKIEARFYDTEIRNPITIFIDKYGKQKAFLTVSTPPKRSIECFMLEYTGESCTDLINHFEAIWNLHNDDIALISSDRECLQDN